MKGAIEASQYEDRKACLEPLVCQVSLADPATAGMDVMVKEAPLECLDSLVSLVLLVQLDLLVTVTRQHATCKRSLHLSL